MILSGTISPPGWSRARGRTGTRSNSAGVRRWVHAGGLGMKIGDVRCYTVSGTTTAAGSDERQVGMLDVYPEYAARTITPRPAGAPAPISATYVEVESDD